MDQPRRHFSPEFSHHPVSICLSNIVSSVNRSSKSIKYVIKISLKCHVCITLRPLKLASTPLSSLKTRENFYFTELMYKAQKCQKCPFTGIGLMGWPYTFLMTSHLDVCEFTYIFHFATTTTHLEKLLISIIIFVLNLALERQQDKETTRLC